MVKIFKSIFKGRHSGSKASESANEEIETQRSSPQDDGMVANYEEVMQANDKAIQMLGVNDNSGHAGKKGLGNDKKTKGKKGKKKGKEITSVAFVSDAAGRSGSFGRRLSQESQLSAASKSSHHSSASSNGARPRRRTQLDHTQLIFETDFEDMVLRERLKDWAASFRRLDPRYMIMKYFNDVAINGAASIEQDGAVTRAELLSPILAMFRRSAVFSVWRPTSMEAIRKMMMGTGTGKGLNIKGKSSKTGELSGYVPYVQINEEKHKHSVKPMPRDAKVRIFYRKCDVRDAAAKTTEEIAAEMANAVEEAKAVLDEDMSVHVEGCSDSEAERRMKWWDCDDFSVTRLEEYSKNKGWGPFAKAFGIEIPERLFWEAFVCRQDVTRPTGSIYDSGRKSEPAYQDMNFGSTRVWKKGTPRTVVWQHADPKKGQSPMDPRTLLVSYEENNHVLPVVSDFDCFLVGTRGVSFENPVPDEQVEMLTWCVDNIEGILDTPCKDGWSKRWLNVLRTKPAGLAPMPPYGYGDPKTYSIMECAVGRLGDSGAVRHGAECFNYYFPQDLDDELLIIDGDAPAGEVPWKYVSKDELKEFLIEKISKGYAFPLNPKWIMCDHGWKDVYDKLLSSKKSNVQEALDCWYPLTSGIRERIESIHSRHPEGFGEANKSDAPKERNVGVRRTMALTARESSHRQSFKLSAMDDDFDIELEQLKLLHADEDF